MPIKPTSVYKSEALISFLVESGVALVDAQEIVLNNEIFCDSQVYSIPKTLYDDYEGIPKELAEENVALREALYKLFERLEVKEDFIFAML